MNPSHRPSRAPAAFALDRSVQRARGALKAIWWGSAAAAARAVVGKPKGRWVAFAPSAPPPPEGFVRDKWREAFTKDAADVAAGLYPPMDETSPRLSLAVDLIADAREVQRRRVRGGGLEARDEVERGAAYPVYYRQNFHFQSGGWFTDASARRYETQVEALFAGAAGAMRRRALSLLARAWRGRDHRSLRLLDLACGSGGFLKDLSRAFPRARLTGLDLSPPYLAEAARASGVHTLVQANAERLPVADGSLDAVTCVYLFHELPPRARLAVTREIARVLRPGGLLAFADSLQPCDEPRLERLLEAFPAYFHEPYYASYGATHLPDLFGGAGLIRRDQDCAFLTKALLFEKAA